MLAPRTDSNLHIVRKKHATSGERAEKPANPRGATFEVTFPSFIASLCQTSHRNIVQFPQELIDAIIDKFDISLADKNRDLFPDRETLRSCALAARKFVRPSQPKLFSEVNLCTYSSPDDRAKLFSKLLSFAHHIRPYVRTLTLSYAERSNSIDRILSSLPKLKALFLHPWGTHGRRPAFPVQLRASFLAVLSTDSLRRLDLRDHTFDGPHELQQILSNSAGLKELALRNVGFANRSPQPCGLRSDLPCVVLESLEVFKISTEDMEALLNVFTVVDATSLRSISCDRFYKPLLQANLHSVQELTLTTHPTIPFYEETLEQVLPATSSLRSLVLRSFHVPILLATIRRLGDLTGMAALEKVSVTAPADNWTAWRTIDVELAKISPKVQIHIGLIDYPQGDEVACRRALSKLDAKGILSISSASRGPASPERMRTLAAPLLEVQSRSYPNHGRHGISGPTSSTIFRVSPAGPFIWAPARAPWIQHILSNSRGLKELALRDIKFSDLSSCRSESYSDRPRVVLESLLSRIFVPYAATLS
ncbi:hypothetical protein B0H17DRAFT_1144056 [Mycena rosella]|uniref:F-box domain-containing protein n=1 Tax=Mycena rosella TaxID=1033263 RepID=A0AAD7G768_MYCRO|nr:hypothetical protein B0H17DRAFT_1144056 [Mycena rosella]